MTADLRVGVVAHLLAGRYAEAAETFRRFDDPEVFTRFVDQQHLRLFFARYVEQGLFGATLPAAWAARLVKGVRAQRDKQDRLVAELDRISRALTSVQLDHILLKGPYLADRFFGGIHNRSYVDLDLLVRRRDIARAGRALETAGYARRSGTLLGLTVTSRFAHAFDYTRILEGPHGLESMTVDLHGGLSLHPSFRIDYDRLWGERSEWRLSDRPISVLSDGDEVVLAVLGIVRDGERGAARLKLFVDVFHVLQKLERIIDWDEFFARCARERLLRPVLGILDLFFELFGCRGMLAVVSSAVEARRSLVPNASASAWILRPSGLPVRHKAWSARLYEWPGAASFIWWGASLPFRLTVYHRKSPIRSRSWPSWHVGRIFGSRRPSSQPSHRRSG
jgi:hypothetical protein